MSSIATVGDSPVSFGCCIDWGQNKKGEVSWQFGRGSVGGDPSIRQCYQLFALIRPLQLPTVSSLDMWQGLLLSSLLPRYFMAGHGGIIGGFWGSWLGSLPDEPALQTSRCIHQ